MSPFRIVALAVGLLVLAGASRAGAAEPKQIRAALDRSLPLIEKGNTGHLENRVCFACHHQTFPVLALSIARTRGVAIDEKLFQKNLKAIAAFLGRNREKYLQGEGQGGQVDTAGSALWTLHLGGWWPDQTTAAVAEYLLLREADKDHWRGGANRPPSEASSFTTTYMALRALDAFATADQQKRGRDRLDG